MAGLLLVACGQLIGVEDTQTQGSCSSSAECAPRYECLQGACRNGCASDLECGEGARCLKAIGTSACVPKGQGGVGGADGGSGGASPGFASAAGSRALDGGAGGGGAGGGAAGTDESGGAAGNSPDACPSVADQGYEGRLYLENQDDIVQALHPFFQLVRLSSSSVELSRVKLRYYFTSEGSGPAATDCFWVTGDACSSAQFRVAELTPSTATATHFIELSFPDATTSFGFDDLEVRVGLHYGNQNLRQTNDYSFDATPNVAAPTTLPYRTWSRVTAYIDDELVWGREPCLATD